MFDRCTGLTLELAKISKGAVPPSANTPPSRLKSSSPDTSNSSQGKSSTGFNIISAGQLHGPLESVTVERFASVPVYILPDGSTYIFREDGKQVEVGRLEFIEKLKGENLI